MNILEGQQELPEAVTKELTRVQDVIKTLLGEDAALMLESEFNNALLAVEASIRVGVMGILEKLIDRFYKERGIDIYVPGREINLPQYLRFDRTIEIDQSLGLFTNEDIVQAIESLGEPEKMLDEFHLKVLNRESFENKPALLRELFSLYLYAHQRKIFLFNELLYLIIGARNLNMKCSKIGDMVSELRISLSHCKMNPSSEALKNFHRGGQLLGRLLIIADTRIRKGLFININPNLDEAVNSEEAYRELRILKDQMDIRTKDTPRHTRLTKELIEKLLTFRGISIEIKGEKPKQLTKQTVTVESEIDTSEWTLYVDKISDINPREMEDFIREPSKGPVQKKIEDYICRDPIYFEGNKGRFICLIVFAWLSDQKIFAQGEIIKSFVKELRGHEFTNAGCSRTTRIADKIDGIVVRRISRRIEVASSTLHTKDVFYMEPLSSDESFPDRTEEILQMWKRIETPGHKKIEAPKAKAQAEEILASRSAFSSRSLLDYEPEDRERLPVIVAEENFVRPIAVALGMGEPDRTATTATEEEILPVLDKGIEDREPEFSQIASWPIIVTNDIEPSPTPVATVVRGTSPEPVTQVKVVEDKAAIGREKTEEILNIVREAYKLVKGNKVPLGNAEKVSVRPLDGQELETDEDDETDAIFNPEEEALIDEIFDEESKNGDDSKTDEEIDILINVSEEEVAEEILADLAAKTVKEKARPKGLWTRKKEREIIAAAKNGDEKAAGEVIKNTDRLVKKIAFRYAKGDEDYECLVNDLFQEGRMGVIIALEKFDLERGYTFSTYAIWWIKQKMRRYMENNNPQYAARLPVYLNQKISKIKRAIAILYTRDGISSPSLEQISDELGNTMNTIEISKILERAHNAKKGPSLDERVNDDNDTTFTEIIPDHSYLKKVKEVEDTQMGERLSDIILDSLKNPRQCAVLLMHAGIGIPEGMSLEEIGAFYNVTRERIRQIEAKALGRLRKKPRIKNLEAYIN